MSVGIKASLAYRRPPEQHTPADVDGPSILLAELRIPLARRLRRHHVTEAPNLDPVLPPKSRTSHHARTSCRAAATKYSTHDTSAVSDPPALRHSSSRSITLPNRSQSRHSQPS